MRFSLSLATAHLIVLHFFNKQLSIAQLLDAPMLIKELGSKRLIKTYKRLRNTRHLMILNTNHNTVVYKIQPYTQPIQMTGFFSFYPSKQV